MRHKSGRAGRVFLLTVFASAVIGLIAAGQERAKTKAPPPTARDVLYGPHSSNTLDFWISDGTGTEPAPLLVFIHGGGFVAGDKGSIDGRVVRWALEDGMAVASLNYRFVTEAAFPAPMHDCARAIQFLRSKAEEWRIDPDRIAAFGGSAGAGISMWLGFHDDLSRPDSADPVERQSTRLAVVGSVGGQTTYDPTVIRDLIGGRAWEHPSLRPFYGMASIAEVDDPKWKNSYAEASPITHLTRDDPPIYMIYTEPGGPLPAKSAPGKGIHHPRFGTLLEDRMKAMGIGCVNRHLDRSGIRKGAGNGDSDGGRKMYEFLRDRLKPTRASGGSSTAPSS